MLDSITAALTSSGTAPLAATSDALIAMMLSLIFGLIISLSYLKTNKRIDSLHGFAVTLAILPVIMAVIILFVGNDVARAFSLAGTASIIRFRSAPGEPKDIGFIFFALAAGLSCGVGLYTAGGIFTVFLSITVLILEKVRFGQKKNPPQTLKITIPEDLNYKDAFTDILEINTEQYDLKRVKTTELGSLFELNYQVVLNKDTDEKHFLDELRCRNGNLSIILTMAPAE
ncbi:MAG TPA: DUF4956 domain-containing protein [Anaerovoracaceae bacterium]|nr:DUF4956 domain-containing protein [Anaerovoracaceae bacterium]